MRPTLIFLVAAILTALGVTPAHAASGTYLRLAHLSPDTPSVDVTVTNFARPDWSVKLDGVGYGAVSGYQRVEPGTYTIAMRAAGADPKSPPVISATLQATEGRAYTVAGLGKFTSLALKVLDDDISLPPRGQARMRVVNAAPKTGELDIRRAGVPVIERAVFGQATTYSLIPSGANVLQVVPKDTAPTDLPVTLDPGGVYTVLVLEKNGTLTTEVTADAKGAEVVPTGGVETGEGGTSPTVLLTLGFLVVAGAAGALFTMLVRRRG
ncbi:DUF4397 domain-containing protein [Actinokineospora globicatena]|uniref:DUF4397 domain-containing protein n=1 Tax=Actinokineospora globicatena TaxID=103729 RepID=UPI0020A378F4|nr:DUF4397 domain-containing protein [Actinokineospora globicatena]MCP2305573.1 protein of unknown function (DUF4397) [Actinokineospora globicatena]GLW81443.1 cell wall anchor [Actinokineospora globicatena]GLW87859.1 cell wall anchor [Actinokineospora globicatena]